MRSIVRTLELWPSIADTTDTLEVGGDVPGVRDEDLGAAEDRPDLESRPGRVEDGVPEVDDAAAVPAFDEIWPWIVQIGYGRAGFYAYDLLDNLGRPSAERIIAGLQDPKIGDWIPMSPTVNDTTAFRVKAFEPNRLMLWSKPDSTWAWSLRPIDAEHTRLVCRIKAKYLWTKPIVLASLFLMEFGDFPMSRHGLLGIKRRAEALAAPRRSSPPRVEPVSSAA